MEQNKLKVKAKTRNSEPRLMLMKSISDFLGKDERIIMFRKIKNKVFMYAINSKSFKKIPLKEKPKTYAIHEFENLGTFLYKLNREQKVK